ncbi:uncharacterized protein MELLADRAFT_71280 [Melampsora larici-populina 98AG31]|uniref:Uncharacterized protein n=1 Tax=Melampsora larici-populina (strain 98AG31 / pathotype 3-4-7) TaxID=747676 RepID=F4REC7_MELLP|nr:uncharacterized protein MELLADRAFT_71280 [Melampsora larici-populina 98AG31]EGG09068.1 hypothetical protein MELLADRAFT_71280 [Melampsora larici-populina 98AG31]
MSQATVHSGAGISAFIAALPPNINVYDALIPFLYKNASACNPRWMSYVLMVLLLTHVTYVLYSFRSPVHSRFVFLKNRLPYSPHVLSSLFLSLWVFKKHIQTGSYWFIKRSKSGLLKPDRVLWESIGTATYAGLSIVDMSCQLYTDINEIPIRGKLLLEWYRYPICGFMFWGVMWGTISNRVRAMWDPTFREDHAAAHCGMPKWVTNTLNGSFIIFGVSILIGLPALYIPVYLADNRILDILDKVADGLRIAASSSEAKNFSWNTLNPILDPLAKFPLLYHKLAVAFKRTHRVFGTLDFTLIITFIIFVFLTYKHHQALEQNGRSLGMDTNPARRTRKIYQEEVKSIFIEAFFILIWQSSYLPVFIWTFCATSDAKLLLSSASVIVPELTLGLVASVVANIVMGHRLASSKRMLACQVLPTNSTSTPDEDGIKLRDRMYQEYNKYNASGIGYISQMTDHSSAEKTSSALSEAT